MICAHAPTDAGVGSAGGRSGAEPPRTNGVASECHGALQSGVTITPGRSLFPKLSQTVINTNHFWDRSFSHFPSQIPIFSNQNIKFFQNNFVIFSDAVLLVEAGGRLPTGTRCRISCLQLSTTSCRHEKSARRRTRSGGPRTARTGAERRPRTFEPWQGSKKKNDTDSVSFFFQARDGDRTRDPLLGKEVLHR